jgi:hypothetical protein
MSRNLQAAVTSASYDDTVRFRLLVEVHSLTAGAVTRACNGRQFVTFAANTYSPVGHLGGISKIQEDSDIFARGMELWFAAVNTAQIREVLAETLFNCPVKVFRAFLTDSLTIVASAEQLWSGYVERVEMKLKDPQRGDHFVIEAESRLARPARAQYFNRETLQNVLGSSGDTFFSYMHQIPFIRANWGRSILEGYQDPQPEVFRGRR